MNTTVSIRERPTLCRRDCRCVMCVRTKMHIVTLPKPGGDRPNVCRANCRCDWCVRTAMHVVKNLRKNDPNKQTRSTKSAREIDATAKLADALR